MSCPPNIRLESVLLTIKDAKTGEECTVELDFNQHGFTVSVPSGECFVLDYFEDNLTAYKYGAHDGLDGEKIGSVLVW